MNHQSLPHAGTIIGGKYRVDRLLGHGGMGFVVAATHLQLDEPVALKFLHDWMTQDAALVTRFEREAKAARMIKSEHVVRILDVDKLPSGTPFLVMEYLDGVDLDGLLRRGGPQPVQVTVDYVLQAMEALSEAHALGLVHRDLKPANLFITKRADGTPLIKVLDFGISKVTGQSSELSLTKTDAKTLGSPLYMAPEQMRSHRTVDVRADIWALGVIMYELLAGVPPFNGETMTELCAVILQDPPTPLRGYRPDTPPVIDGVIGRCLAKDPNARFANVAELASALAPFASPAGRFSAERVAGVLRNVVTGTAATEPMARPMAPRSLAPRPHSLTAPKSWADATMSAGPTNAPTPPAPKRGLPLVLVGVSVVVAALISGGVVYGLKKERVTSIHIGGKAAPGEEEREQWPDDDEPAEAPKKNPRKKEPPQKDATKALELPAALDVQFDPISGVYGHAFEAKLTTRTEGGVIHYTIDGSEPTEASPVYKAPIPITNPSTVVNAVAIAPEHRASKSKQASYQIAPSNLDVPLSVTLEETRCGKPGAPSSFVVRNRGATVSFAVQMTRGDNSPFLVSANSASIAKNGQTTIQVVPKPAPMHASSLDGLTDTVEFIYGGARPLHVTVKEAVMGGGFEILDADALDFADTPVSKRSDPKALRIRGIGRLVSAVTLTSDKPGFEIAPSTLTLAPGHVETARIVFHPTGAAEYTGSVKVMLQGEGCSLPATIQVRGTAR